MSQNLLVRWVVLLLFVSGPVVASAASLRALIEYPEVTNVTISPNGQYLAVRLFKAGKHQIVTLNRLDSSLVGSYGVSGKDDLGSYYWANDDRIVIKLNEVRRENRPSYYGQLMAMNHDGTRSDLIYGYRAGGGPTLALRRQKGPAYAWAEIVDLLPADDTHILVSSTKMSRDGSKRAAALRLNIYTGEQDKPIKLTRYGSGRFFTDQAGQIRLTTSVKDDRSIHVSAYPDKTTGWIEFPDHLYDESFRPLAISEQDSSVFVLDRVAADKVGLYKLKLDGSSVEKIYARDNVDISDAAANEEGDRIFALRVDDGYPSYVIFQSGSAAASVFKTLLGIFEGHMVSITSGSRDGNLWVVSTSTDTDAGSYYLYDVAQESITFLMHKRPTVDPNALAQTRPIQFESFDGTQVFGFYTPPAPSNAASASDVMPEAALSPMVVLVHGGPRVRDYWGYDGEVQALSTRGFGVLRINYRGSIGYGRDFLEAGNRQWGQNVQQDIITGTRWAIAQGLAAEDRVCIMGASFGAYSALQSSILAPDLYRCIIAASGVYDLNRLVKEGDTSRWYQGEDFFKETLGDDQDELYRYSPVNGVSKLKAPVLIAHGRQDKRTPFHQAEDLRDALGKSGKDFQWFERKREGHGFYDVENRLAYLELVLSFLNDNLQVPRTQ